MGRRTFNTVLCCVCGRPSTDVAIMQHLEIVTGRDMFVKFAICDDHRLKDLQEGEHTMVVLVDVTA